MLQSVNKLVLRAQRNAPHRNTKTSKWPADPADPPERAHRPISDLARPLLPAATHASGLATPRSASVHRPSPLIDSVPPWSADAGESHSRRPEPCGSA